MKLNEYNREREQLSKYIQDLTGDSTLLVEKVLHGNHNGQVHLYIRRMINNQTTSITSEIMLLELVSGGEIPRGINIYSQKTIDIIINSINPEKLKATCSKLY